jgi:hypothetical protein
MPLAKPNIKTTLDRPARLRGLALLALLLLVLAILGGMIWRNLQRLNTIQAYVSYSHQIQQAGLTLQQALVDSLSSGAGLSTTRLTELLAQIQTLLNSDAHLAPDTPAQLRMVYHLLAGADGESPDNAKSELFNALRVMHQILDTETDQREKVLEAISRDTLAELELATAIRQRPRISSLPRWCANCWP